MFQVTFDAADPAALSGFWRQALAHLGYQPAPPPAGFADWPEFLAAQGVPESEWNSAAALVDPSGQGRGCSSSGCRSRRPPRTACIWISAAAAARASRSSSSGPRSTRPWRAWKRLGATFVERSEELGVVWAVMHDPEGNEFCAWRGPPTGRLP